MSCYIKLKNESILEFLNRTGEKVSLKYVINYFLNYKINTNKYPICLIHLSKNIVSAPILYNKWQLKRVITDYGTNNLNEYYIVPLKDLKEVSDIDYYI